MNYLMKDIPDTRALTDAGAAIFIKRSNDTKYHLWLAVTNIPATGAAPDQVETTTTTTRVKTYTEGRQDTPQKEITFYAHRDNFEILKADFGKQYDFLQVNPDLTGWKFTGKVSFYQDEVSVGSNLEGRAVITVARREELPLNDVSDIIQETVTFETAIPATLVLTGTNNEKINVVTDPSGATATATSSSTSVATATLTGGVLTITAVAAGTTIVTITASQTDCASAKTHILVKVVAE